MKKLYQILCILSLIASLICAPFATTTWRFGLLFFVTLCLCTGAMWGLINLKKRPGLEGKAAKWLVNIGNMVFILWVISFAVVEGMIVSGIRSEPQEPVEVLFVLGGGLRGDQPTQNLQNRLVAGMEAMEQYPDAQVIVCGGQGDDEDQPEAEVMYRWMAEHGADTDRITLESQSRNTIQNIENAMAICEQKNWGTEHVTVVSSGFHLFRIRHIMKSCGLAPSVIGAPAGNPAARTLMYIREYFSVIKLLLSGYW
ncbi:MAG: YdcF family protein [Clostridia bacterium]|nr:YdcF family protein [Clostridia bacterium]